MVHKLTAEIIDRFVRLGQANSENDPSFKTLLSEISSYSHVNRLHWNEWNPFTKKMSTSNLESLIKGLTIAETHYKWSGGSVAAVIWVFNQFANREQPQLVEKVAMWVFENRWNCYIPFGTLKYSSYEDYIWKHSTGYYELKRKKIEAHKKREKEQQKVANRRRLDKARTVIEHKNRAQQKAKNRQKTIDNLTDMVPEERWNFIAMNKSVTIDYYPTEWANESEQVLRTLSSETRTALIERLHYKRKGPWKKLRKLLHLL